MAEMRSRGAKKVAGYHREYAVMDDKAEVAKLEGNAHLANGEYVLALRRYTEAIQLTKGRDHTLYSNRAFAFTRLGQYARAIVDADAAIQLAPHWPKGYYRRAEGFRLAGLPTQALHAYRVASSVDRTDEHLQACCVQSVAEVRRAQKRGYAIIAVGLAIGLALAVLLSASEAYAKGEMKTASLVLVSLSLSTLGALGGVGSLELWRYQLASRAAAPAMPNDEFVRFQFPDMPAPKAPARRAGAAETVSPAGEEDAAVRHRRARTTNKSFRNRGA
jgi:tetratricopeptide (TPR) repeat protein